MSDKAHGRSARLALSLALCVTACGGKDDPDKPYRAKIVASTGNGDYELTTVTFKTLTNVDRVEGDLAVLKGGAALDLNAEIDEIVTSHDPDEIYAKKGKSVSLDYIVNDGVVYPKNFDSMAMLAIYYNFETTYLYWEENLGLSRKDFGRLDLYYNPRVMASDKASTISGTLKVNAAFVPGPRDFWFFKTSRLEKVPINMNLGVMAHEFSHGIFDYAFAGKKAATHKGADETADEQLSGINEGLADFFSYMVTASVEEFGASLDILDEERKMPVAWTLSKLHSAPCVDSFYCKGSILASALHEISTSEGQSALEVGKIVYQALPKFREDWDAHKRESTFDYYYLIARIIAEAEAANPANKELYCTVFKKWFDVESINERFGCD